MESPKLIVRATVLRFWDGDGKVYRTARSGVATDALRTMFLDRLLEEEVVVGDVLLNEGAEAIWKLVTGDTTVTPFNGANACIGVGDGTDPEDPTQTGLTGTNKYYKQVDSGYPVIQGNSIIYRATFGSTEANFAWNEWTVANGCSDDAINLNRKQEALGTKSSGQTWILEVELQLS